MSIQEIKNGIKSAVAGNKSFEHMVDNIAMFIAKNFNVKKVTLTTTLESSEIEIDNQPLPTTPYQEVKSSVVKPKPNKQVANDLVTVKENKPQPIKLKGKARAIQPSDFD